MLRVLSVGPADVVELARRAGLSTAVAGGVAGYLVQQHWARKVEGPRPRWELTILGLLRARGVKVAPPADEGTRRRLRQELEVLRSGRRICDLPDRGRTA